VRRAQQKSKVAAILQSSGTRYTIDASVFVNAFRPHEPGHGESLRFLSLICGRGDAVIVPTLVLTEIAASLARANDNSEEAIDYADALAQLPNVTLVPLSLAMARKAAEAAANFRLRGADAIYIEVARRFATTLVSRDEEQLKRGGQAVGCQTPEEAMDAH
jgi:predicted nucleic acid-binding protein